MASPNSISVSQLSRLIGAPDQPLVYDLCIDEDFALDPCLIPGAKRFDHRAVEQLAPAVGDRRVVTVCQKGKKLSQGAVAVLREQGVRAEYLEGGVIEWRAQGAPMVPLSAIPKAKYWVTRHRPKIDRIACPWLIRRFVDPAARFIFVAPSEVAAVADRFDAALFDVDDCFWTHRGDGCTFDTMLEEFALNLPALNRLAKVVRAADLGQPENTPQAAGLLAISVGLSRQHKDDNEQLEAGLMIYDALFRWARDGFEETHASAIGKQE